MPHAPSHFLQTRLGHVRAMSAAGGLDALIVTSLPNISYLTNFRGSAAIAVLTEDRVLFLTDFRYVAAVEAMASGPGACPGLALARVESSYDETLAEVVRDFGAARVGFEASHVTAGRLSRLAAVTGGRCGSERGAGGQGGPVGRVKGPEFVPTERLVESVRVRKDPHEIATIQKAAAMLSAAVPAIVKEVGAGRLEREVAAVIDFRLRQAGFERPAFETVVAGGPNAALPHARPGDRPLADGDLVVLDFGGVYDGYCVDLTRTVAVARADAEVRRVYAAVLEAHQAAVGAVRPGRSRHAIDKAAREALGRHGLAEAFGHSTGHGLGIEVHEEPRISRRRPSEMGQSSAGSPLAPPEEEPVDAGMVFTIEPGAYIAGWGGVRIEDDVLVTPDGVAMLTTAPRDLIVV